jgi:predicted dehydrogenase
MLADEGLDFIYIASPNSLHFEQALDALRAGKNVICEKPFTTYFNEALLLAAEARSRGLFLFEAITTPFLPNVKMVRDLLPSISPVRIIKCNFSQYSLRYKALLDGELPNNFNPLFSGGALMDLNIYNLHLMATLFGFPLRSTYYPNLHSNGIDTSGIALLEYEGFKSECTASKDSGGKNFILIQGENGYIYIGDSAGNCRNVEIKRGNVNEKYDQQEGKDCHYFEIDEFSRIYKNRDTEKCYELLDYSCKVMDLLEKTRDSGNIRFKAVKR